VNGYFFDQAGDQRMEKQNIENWLALIRLIQKEAHTKDPQGKPSLPDKAWDILDIGCHTGGLLNLLNLMTRVASISGVEPLQYGRVKAQSLLHKSKSNFFETIQEVPDQSAHLLVSHETLYLVNDLYNWTKELKRILRPDGGAFISLGSHSENTAWLRWRNQLKNLYGHISYVHRPIEILGIGTGAGFDMELHRLHPEPHTSMRFSSPENGWGEFLSAQEALGFQKQKYVFVFYPKR